MSGRVFYLFSASSKYNMSILTRSVTGGELDKCKVETVRMLEKILALESVPLFTQNTDFLDSEEKKWLSTYTRIRDQSSSYRVDCTPPIRSPHPSYPWLPVEPEVPPVGDQFHNALIVMANVRAYFQVAYKVFPIQASLLRNKLNVITQRIIDYIPLAIEHELNQSLAINFRTRLFESLLQQPNAADKMKILWSEDPALAKRRSFLEERRARLMQIKQRLDDFRERRE